MTTRTYRVKLYLSKAAHVALDDQLRAQARLYNAALEERRWAYKMAGESVTFVLQSRELTQVRVDDPEYAAVHRTIQVATLRRLDRAFQNFFRRVKKGEKPGYPRFKSSRRWRSLVCDNNIQARSMVKLGDNGKGKVRIKGLPPMEFRCKRELPPIDNLVELRVIKPARRVEAQLVFTTEAEDPEPVRHPERPVGVDVGINAVVALSDGSMVPGRNEDRRRTRRLQRRLSRAKKGGHNRRKRVTALAKHRQRQGEARKGWAHEISAGLVIEATDCADTRYIAMEVSFTADRRDYDRAIRNAGLITRFTSKPAQAAIASVRNDREAAEAVESGAVYWPRWRTGHGVPSELRRSRPQPSLTERKNSCQQ